jgi:IAA-amino acid hydrolase
MTSIPGPFTAAGCIFEVKIVGVGGHAAFSQPTVDPLLTTLLTILAVQQLLSREIDPLHSQVCATLNLYFYKKIYP